MPWKVDGLHKGKKKEKGGTLSQMIITLRLIFEQAAADITGPLQVRPMLYTLYIGINLTNIMKQYGDRQTDTNI